MMKHLRITLLAVAVMGVAGLIRPSPAHAEEECFSGGPGSSGCSVSTCSVSCKGGYYACCHATNGCSCIAES